MQIMSVCIISVISMLFLPIVLRGVNRVANRGVRWRGAACV